MTRTKQLRQDVAGESAEHAPAVAGQKLNGTSRADHLAGGRGNDRLCGRGGDDVLKAGAGDDTLEGGSGDDKLYGGGGRDLLSGGSGADRLLGGAGDDQLHGDSGNDKLYGGSGDDVLDGGTGDDHLNGGAGSDIYLFGRGGGHDVVASQDRDGRDVDRLVLGKDIASEQIWMQHNGNHLKLTLLGSGDTLTVRGWYRDAALRLDSIELADGQKLAENRVDALVQAMSSFDPPAPGSDKLSPDMQAVILPVLAANWQ